MKRTMIVGYIGVSGMVLLPLATQAQNDSLQLELGKCSAIADINQRVACYDKLAKPEADTRQTKAAAAQDTTAKTATPAATASSQPPPAAAKTDATEPAESQLSRMEKFGKKIAAKIFTDTATGEDVLVDKVVTLKELTPNKLQITLSNGQVWQQTIAKTFLLRENDSVRISPSGWGSSFRLEIDGKPGPGYIQVSRLR